MHSRNRSAIKVLHQLLPHLWLVQSVWLVVLPEGLGHVCCAPVMAVQDVWLPSSLQQELKSSLAEEIKPHLWVPETQQA